MSRRSKKTIAERRPRCAANVGVGNSLTLDYFSSVRALLDATQTAHPRVVWLVENKAVGGAQTPALTSAFTASVQPFFKQGQLCLLQFCELTNHIAAGASFATARDAAIVYCAQARAAGWRLAFHIPTPRVEKADAGYEASVSAWDAGELAIHTQACDYFRAHPEHYDFLIDLSAVPELVDPHDTDFYLEDGVHCTAAGIAAKASTVAAATVGWGF